MEVIDMFMNRICVVAAMLAVGGCYTGVEDELGDSELRLDPSEVIVENLLEAGFPEDDIMVLGDGRVVVGHDAVVTMQASRELAGIVTDGPEADEEFRQYRTTNQVNTAVVKTICVNPSAQWEGNVQRRGAAAVPQRRLEQHGLDQHRRRPGAGPIAAPVAAPVAEPVAEPVVEPSWSRAPVGLLGGSVRRRARPAETGGGAIV